MVSRARADVCPKENKCSSHPPRCPATKPSKCPEKSTAKCPPNCRPIKYCSKTPELRCPPQCAPPRSTWKCYGPCQSPRCDCPPTWPTMHPHYKCCIREPRVEEPMALPVLPMCRSPRWPPEDCKKKVLTEIPLKDYPPLIPCYSPCRPLPPPPCHTNQIRWLDPVLPYCPPSCSPREIRRIVKPEPPPIPFCPVLPPCNCPAVPLICHNSCRYFRPTALCDKAKDTTNPLVCYVPKDRREVAQYCCDLGYCQC